MHLLLHTATPETLFSGYLSTYILYSAPQHDRSQDLCYLTFAL
jgi:hypothetical protein